MVLPYLALETREASAHVALLELRELASQETTAERGVGDDGDAQFSASSDDWISGKHKSQIRQRTTNPSSSLPRTTTD